MDIVSAVSGFFTKHKKPVIIVTAVVLSILFIGTVLIAVFAGDEFKSESTDSGVKGMMRINKSDYISAYFSGDKFTFYKNSTEIMLVVKDPQKEELVKIKELPSSRYGFMVNGEGDIYDEAKQIVMTPDIEKISVVSKDYPSVSVDIPVTVYGGVDKAKLTDSLVLEAENAELYRAGKLLTVEEKSTMPSENKPFLSSAGEAAGEDCSGGACLRNFGKLDMRVVFDIVSYMDEPTDVTLDVLVCKRSSSGKLGSFYDITLNDEHIEALDEAVIPMGTGYFMPYTVTVTVKLRRGLNRLEFASGAAIGRSNPVNLDGIVITAPQNILAPADALL